MISYQNREVPKIGLVVDVFINDNNKRKKTGTIWRVLGGWQYQTISKQTGEILQSIEAVKRSLEE